MLQTTNTFAKQDRCQLLRMYERMLLIRAFEERVAELVEAKEIRTPCHLYIGQEAIAVGVCEALNMRDTIWGAHRSHGHYLAKGADPKSLMAELFAKETGCAKGRGGSMHLCAPAHGILGTVPLVAATIPLAVGAALASNLRKDGLIAVSFFGDGATEEGHFHESLNFAALYKLPILFVCENNVYASHMSLAERRRRDNIIASAEAHGLPGESIDGNDVVAVLKAATVAAQRARQGEGPTLLECRTYRWRGHVGASWDMDVGVRRKDELAGWLVKDPIRRLECVLGANDRELERIRETIHDEIDQAVEFARRSPAPPASETNRFVYFGSTADA